MVLALCYAATQLFAGRAAFLLVGAMLATIMSANVFFVIIPGQKRMVAALARGEAPDPLPGLRGKQRSVHNTYFTLPVVFAMLSIHYAAAYAHPHSWLVLALFMAAGALDPPVLRAVAQRRARVVAAGGGAGVAGDRVRVAGAAWRGVAFPDGSARRGDARWPTTPSAPTSPRSRPCSPSAAAPAIRRNPTLLPSPPLGVAYDTPAQIETHAARIHQQTVVLRIMPPGNLTGMTEAERAAIDAWFLGR